MTRRFTTAFTGAFPGAASGIGLVMVAAALWATVGVAVQITPAGGRIPEILLAAARTGIAGPMLLAAWALGMGAGRMATLRRLAPGPLVVFALASAVFQICLFKCFAQLGVTPAVFLTVCLPPILACLWSMLRGAAGLSGQSGGALVLALGGMVLVALGGPDGAAPEAVHGVVNGVIASVAFVAMSFAAATLAQASRPILFTGAGLTLSALVLGGLAVGVGQVGAAEAMPANPGAEPVLLIFYLGLFPTALAYLCYCTGMARCRTPAIGLVASMIEPLLAALLAAVLLGEHVSGAMIAGCVLLTGAMVLLWRAERDRPTFHAPTPTAPRPTGR